MNYEDTSYREQPSLSADYASQARAQAAETIRAGMKPLWATAGAGLACRSTEDRAATLDAINNRVSENNHRFDETLSNIEQAVVRLLGHEPSPPCETDMADPRAPGADFSSQMSRSIETTNELLARLQFVMGRLNRAV